MRLQEKSSLCEAVWSSYSEEPVWQGSWWAGRLCAPFILLPEDSPDGKWHLFAHTWAGIEHFVSFSGFDWQRIGLIVLRGHFPDYPVVPGVILCEMIAQSACVLMQGEAENMAGKTPFYTGIDNVRFRSQVRPKDRVRIETKLTGKKACFYFIHGELYVGDKLCVKGDFSFAVVDANKV